MVPIFSHNLDKYHIHLFHITNIFAEQMRSKKEKKYSYQKSTFFCENCKQKNIFDFPEKINIIGALIFLILPMKSSITLLPKSKVEITLEETKENIAKYRKKAIAQLRQEVKIPGFRPGVEVPEAIFLKHVGEDRIATMTIDKALQKIYTQALQDHQLRPLTAGELVEIVSQDPLKVIMHVEVVPTVTLKDGYRSIQLEKTTVEVSDEEVDAALREIQVRFTRYQKTDSEYSVQMGDKVVIDTI